MLTTVRSPQIDVNDPNLTVAAVLVTIGQEITPDTELAVLETMKASIAVTAERPGLVRSIYVQEGEDLPVDAPMFLLADSMDEPLDEVPAGARPGPACGQEAAGASGRPTAKARLLAKKLGVDIGAVSAGGARIARADVEALAPQGSAPRTQAPLVPHRVGSLSSVEKGVMASVVRSSREAVSAYLETMVDLRPVMNQAEELRQRKGLLFDPLFAVVCWHFLRLIARQGSLNAAWSNDSLIEYTQINLGFTMDSSGELLFPVIRQADQYSLELFVEAIFAVQRRAAQKKLAKEELGGATIGVTSLAVQGVQRHIPILFPGTSVMLALSATTPLSPPGTAFSVLGATYDHRIHNGGRVARMLRALAMRLANPPGDASK